MKRPTRARFAVILIALPLVAMLLATTAVAAAKKPYAATLEPGGVLAGRCFLYTASLQNQTKTQQLGSANYTLDPRFDVNATDAGDCQLDPAFLSISSGGASPSIQADPNNDHVLQLRDLALAPPTSTAEGGKVTFTFSAMTSCPPGTSPYVNSVIAKQANNYSGDPGNNMTPGTPYDTSVDVAGTCTDDEATTALSQTGLKGTYTLVSNGEANGRLILAAGYQTVDCAGYDEHTDTVTADLVFNTTDTKTLTLIFNNVNNELKSAFKFCYDPDEDGTTFGPTLAPNCTNKDPNSAQNTPICVLDVTEKNHKITMKVLLQAGDLKGRG